MAKAESTEIEGHWAEQAKEIIDVDYLLDQFSNQEAGWSEVRVRKWGALAAKLGVAKDRDMLIKMPQYISVTPHAVRYPGAQGMRSTRSPIISPCVTKSPRLS